MLAIMPIFREMSTLRSEKHQYFLSNVTCVFFTALFHHLRLLGSSRDLPSANLTDSSVLVAVSPKHQYLEQAVTQNRCTRLKTSGGRGAEVQPETATVGHKQAEYIHVIADRISGGAAEILRNHPGEATLKL